MQNTSSITSRVRSELLSISKSQSDDWSLLMTFFRHSNGWHVPPSDYTEATLPPGKEARLRTVFFSPSPTSYRRKQIKWGEQLWEVCLRSCQPLQEVSCFQAAAPGICPAWSSVGLSDPCVDFHLLWSDRGTGVFLRRTVLIWRELGSKQGNHVPALNVKSPNITRGCGSLSSTLGVQAIPKLCL